EAGTAAQALEAAGAHDFDVLVTDVGLPDMKGGELAKQVRQLKPEAGIIFATGQNEMPDGADADAVLLKKPYSDDELKRALAQVR
ncbi:MAG: response regulator, partial [Hoeflea sp.]|nr:response regulator [Hoeflea sp.]